jgi:hypothetical protein
MNQRVPGEAGRDCSPEHIVDAQLRAYNARDTDSYCALFARDALISDANTGEVMLEGIDDVYAHYHRRFTTAPDLHCTVLGRLVAGSLVIDHERVRGLGPAPVEVVAVYEVRTGLIHSLRFLTP